MIATRSIDVEGEKLHRIVNSCCYSFTFSSYPTMYTEETRVYMSVSKKSFRERCKSGAASEKRNRNAVECKTR